MLVELTRSERVSGKRKVCREKAKREGERKKREFLKPVQVALLRRLSARSGGGRRRVRGARRACVWTMTTWSARRPCDKVAASRRNV